MKNSFDMSLKNKEIRVYGNQKKSCDEWGTFSTSARTIKEPRNECKQMKLLGRVNENLKQMKLPF